MRSHFYLVSAIFLTTMLTTIVGAGATESQILASRSLVYTFQRSVGETTTLVSPNSVNALGAHGRRGQRFVAPADEIPRSMDDAVSESGGEALVPIRRGQIFSGYEGVRSQGSIRVDMIGIQPDDGLVVSISEHINATIDSPNGNGASVEKTLDPVSCVVYGNTSVSCAKHAQVSSEGYALLRFLGTNFAKPGMSNPERKWSVDQRGHGIDLKDDYRIVSQHSSNATIAESLTITSEHSADVAKITATIGYDLDRSLPMLISEHVSQRQEGGNLGTVATTADTSMELVIDSWASH